MATGMMADLPQQERSQLVATQRRGYRRALLLSVVATAGVVGLLLLANLALESGPMLLLAQEAWLFWLAGGALAVGAGLLFSRFASTAGRTTPWPLGALLPACATFGGVLLVSLYPRQALAGLIPLLLFPVLFTILVVNYHLHDGLGRTRQLARTAHILLTHGVAFVVLAAIYINKARSLLSATLVGLVVCLLLAQLAAGERFPTERRLLYGLVGGVVLGQITWALNYWPLTGWSGGAVLLIAFYFLAGLLLAQIREGVRRRDLLEYGCGATVLFALVVWSLLVQ